LNLSTAVLFRAVVVSALALSAATTAGAEEPSSPPAGAESRGVELPRQRPGGEESRDPVHRDPGNARLKSTLVKVYTIANPADLLSPWQGLGTEKYVGSGVVIDGRRILTNGHLVADQVSVEVKRQGMTRRYEARVSQVGHACDLALLEVEDASFFDGVEPLDLGRMAELQDTVDVYGFPVGGDSISITSGIVSRVEVGQYSHSGARLLLAQIDAALNPGNSGGPVVADGLIVGLAAQTLGGAENVGYMIPAPVIRHFLADIADGSFDGFPNLGIDLQTVENRALREELGLADAETGGLVSRINYGGSAWGVLEPGDVLLGIDGIDIAEDLTIALDDESSRLAVSWAVARKQVGDEVELRILRDGQRLVRRTTLSQTPMLVPGPRYDEKPPYFVFGGLVFQPLSLDYIDFLYDWNHDLAWYAYHQYLRTAERREIVLLSQVLAAPVNRGYHDWENEIVASVNGVVPRDLPHLIELVTAAAGPRLTVMTAEGRRLVLDLVRARDASASILDRYGVPADRSPGLREAEVPAAQPTSPPAAAPPAGESGLRALAGPRSDL
jgi:S1-C subfamily serine protease